MSKVIDNIEDIASIDTHIGLSGVTAYHLLQGNLAVDNYVTTQGFNTTLYTGNGSTQSINTGIDMATQWGNDASETYGGLVWLKSRSNAEHNILNDTIRGVLKPLSSNLTNAEDTLGTYGKLSAFSNNGFSVNSDTGVNGSGYTYASWNFQTTHRTSGITNHGKAYTCHFNPFTGFTIVKYEGSGIAGHEIPHHLGRKLGFVTVKNLTQASHWGVSSSLFGIDDAMYLNLTNGQSSDQTTFGGITDTSVIVDTNLISNISGNTHILYGWANSYYDEANKLIGNYEIGVYQGTGVAGNKVATRGKPAWVMVKRLDSAGNWIISNNQMTNMLIANSSGTELGVGNITFPFEDGFRINLGNVSDYNTSGGQYLYMVVYDTNSNGGGSFYEKSTDNAQIQAVNTIIPTAQGIDSNGVKNKIVYKNETITGISLLEGKNYVYWEND